MRRHLRHLINEYLAFILLGICGLLVTGSLVFLHAAQPKEDPIALLPEVLQAKLLGDMKEGEEAYAPPDAMIVDQDKKCYLQGAVTLVEINTGFKVVRKKDGYHVTVEDTNNRWVLVDLSKADPAARKALIPVRTLTVPQPKFEPKK